MLPVYSWLLSVWMTHISGEVAYLYIYKAVHGIWNPAQSCKCNVLLFGLSVPAVKYVSLQDTSLWIVKYPEFISG